MSSMREKSGEKKSKAAPLVSVVVVSWNRRENLRRCLQSVEKSTYPNMEIIVVDNHSSDGAPEMVRSEFRDVQLMVTQRNLGCGPARNIGFQAARGKYIIQLDDDATICENGVARMVQVFESDQGVGAVAVKVVNPDSGRVVTADFAENTKNFWGAGAAFRTSVLEKTGLYPQEMFFTAEEMDLSIRIRDLGYAIRYVPDVVVRHFRQDTSKSRISSWRLQNSVCSWLWFFAKYFPWPLVFVFWARVLASHFLLAARHRRPLTLIYSIVLAFQGLPGVIKNRRPLKASTIRYFYNPGILPDRYNIPVSRKILRKFF